LLRVNDTSHLLDRARRLLAGAAELHVSSALMRDL
jgi:hypothetical protein